MSSQRVEARALHPVAVVAALAALTVLAAVVLRDSGTNYDLEYALNWGRAITDGHLPDYALSASPTPHPLTTVLAALADLVPIVDARAVVKGTAYLSYAGLVLCVVLLGAELFSWLAGIAAGVVIGLSTPVLVNTAVAFQDGTTAALILLAVVLEVRQPRRGVAPLVALGLAGLIRPEVWGLAACYWLWQARGRNASERLRLGALAAAAPALWVLSELIITGEPLFSFTHTREGAAAAGRTTGLGEAPGELYDNLRSSIGRTALFGGLAGAVAAVTLARWRDALRAGRPVGVALAAPVGTLVLLCAAFIALGISELSLLERYVIGIVALLAVFCGFALTAWRHLRSSALAILAGVVAVGLLVDWGRGVDGQIDRTQAALDYHREEGDVLDDLRALADGLPTLVSRCGSVSVNSYRTRPYLAYALERQPNQVALATRGNRAPAATVYVVPATRRARDVFTLIGGKGGPLPPRPPGFRTVNRNASWAAYARGC